MDVYAFKDASPSKPRVQNRVDVLTILHYSVREAPGKVGKLGHSAATKYHAAQRRRGLGTLPLFKVQQDGRRLRECACQQLAPTIRLRCRHFRKDSRHTGGCTHP